jgi:hypothetical protein
MAVEGIKAVAAGRPYVTPSLTGFLLQRRSRAKELAVCGGLGLRTGLPLINPNPTNFFVNPSSL